MYDALCSELGFVLPFNFALSKQSHQTLARLIVQFCCQFVWGQAPNEANPIVLCLTSFRVEFLTIFSLKSVLLYESR